MTCLDSWTCIVISRHVCSLASLARCCLAKSSTPTYSERKLTLRQTHSIRILKKPLAKSRFLTGCRTNYSSKVASCRNGPCRCGRALGNSPLSFCLILAMAKLQRSKGQMKFITYDESRTTMETEDKIRQFPMALYCVSQLTRTIILFRNKECRSRRLTPAPSHSHYLLSARTGFVNEYGERRFSSIGEKFAQGVEAICREIETPDLADA
jgi:hypothetical protein